MRRERSISFVLGVFLAVLTLLLTGSLGASTRIGAPPPRPAAAVLNKALSKSDKHAKIESRLVAVDRTAKQRGRGVGADAARRAGLRVVGDRLDVIIEAADDSAREVVAAAGGTVQARYGRLLQALVPADAISGLAASASVRYVRAPRRVVDDAAPAVATATLTQGSLASGITSEGVTTTNAAAWHALGRTGAGVKVAIIGFSFTNATAAQASGDLPASLTTVNFGCPGDPFAAGPSTSGVKRAEVVYQMAPDAALTLICIDVSSEVGAAAKLAQAVAYMDANGIKIAYDSVGIVGDTRGDGVTGDPLAQPIADGAADGVLWVGGTFGLAQEHWSGTFVDANNDGWNEFAGGNTWVNWFYLPSGYSPCVDMTWDSWPTTAQDYDLYVGDQNGNLVASSTSLQNGAQAPLESACSGAPSPGQWYFAAIYKFAGTAKPRIDLWFESGGPAPIYDTPAGTVIDPATSPLVLGVGAICWQSSLIESTNGRGPTIDGRIKPDLVGPASVSTPAGGLSGGCNTGYTGSSSAASHVTGAAALVSGLFPSWTATQIRTFLTSNAKDLGPGGKDNTYGSGRVWLPIAPPTLSSFTPGLGPVGTTVTVNGTGFANATSVRFNGVDAAPIAATPTSVKAPVPPGASTGKVQVVTPDGVATSAGTFKVTPKVTGFSPSTAARGFSPVEIDGSNFTGVTKVTFGSVAAAFTFVDDGEITATVPATAVSGKVTVTTAAGSGSSATNFQVILPPTISSFSPSFGPVGTLVTVSGTALDTIGSATLGGVGVGAITHVGSTQIRFNVPAGGSTGKIAVTNPATTVQSAAVFKVSPKVTGFSPGSGARGSSVEIDGSNFTGATKVLFGAVAATSVTPVDDTKLMATVPATAVSAKITVTTPAGSGSSAASFLVVVPPTVSGFSPSSGSVGTLVTVNGTGLDTVTAATLGGAAVGAITHVGSTQIKFNVPTAAATGKIAVTNPGGTGQSTGVFKVTPKVTGYTPANGAPAGDSVTIYGFGLGGATSVKFGPIAATTFTPVDANTITATVPDAAITGAVTVMTPDGTASGPAFKVVPVITSLSTSGGPVGTVVTISGKTLTGATSVKFNGAAASFSSVTPTSLKATVPAAATTGNLTVTTPGGTATADDPFSIPAKVTSFTPTSGPVGRVVTINGSGFAPNTTVYFGTTQAATVTNVTPTSLKATVPPGAMPGPIIVNVEGGYGQSSSSFAVTLSIAWISPEIGPVGTNVGIVGLGFRKVVNVKVGNAYANFSVIDDTEIALTVPPGATSGPIVVSDGTAAVPSPSSFTVGEPPPDPRQVVFANNNDGDYEIYSIRGDGNGLKQLTNNTATDLFASWSPGATKIVFASNRDGNFELYAMNADGSDQTRLTNTAADENDPEWSPDGAKIVYTRHAQGESNNDVWVMDADGSNQTNLTNTPSNDDLNPAWSPSGAKIAYSSVVSPSVQRELWRMNADGTGQAALTTDAAIALSPTWSADGSKILFTRTGCFSACGTGLWLMNADGSGMKELTAYDVDSRSPSWGSCNDVVFAFFGSIALADPSTGNRIEVVTWGTSVTPDCWQP